VFRPAIALAFAVLFAATNARAETHYYLVDAIATQASDADLRAQAIELEKIYADLERVSGVEARLVYSTDPDINALATEIDGEKIILVQQGLLAAMGDDRDAVAATLGHELGHHKADHLGAGRRKEQGARVVGTLLGAIIGAKLGGRHSGAGAVIGAAAGDVGGNLVALKFNRNQEMEADRLGLGWMIAAGYNPQGMLRLQQRLGELEAGHTSATMFRTHPPSAKRYKAAQDLIAKLAPPAELLARPSAPIADAAAIAAAAEQIRHDGETALAEALDPKLGDIPAAALAPIGAIGFDDYAALQNELVYAGDAGRAHALARHKLDAAKLAELDGGYSARMQQAPALTERYSIAFFRATQGRYAAHGRDLADSFAHHQALRLDPPFPLEQLLAINAATAQPGIDAEKAQAQAIAAAGMTTYEFLIGRNWWMRKAAIAALTGDTTLIARISGRGDDEETATDDDEDAADDAGVHIGEGVHVGDGVRIGGHDKSATSTQH
jgi:Zn-dependent protease with chaperone function